MCGDVTRESRAFALDSFYWDCADWVAVFSFPWYSNFLCSCVVSLEAVDWTLRSKVISPGGGLYIAIELLEYSDHAPLFILYDQTTEQYSSVS